MAMRVFLFIGRVLECLVCSKTIGKELGTYLLKNIPSIYTVSFALFSTFSFLILKRLFYLMSPGLEDGLHPRSLAHLRPSHIFKKYLKSICAQDKGARTKVSLDFPAYRGSDRLRSKVTSEA